MRMNPQRLSLYAALLAGTLLLAACANQPQPDEPEGGFIAFRDALLAKDATGVWATLSDDTRDLFSEAHDALQVMQQLIRHLGPGDREAARDQSGVLLLRSIDSPEALFRHLFNQATIPDERALVVGLQVQHVEPVDDSTAMVHTRGLQAFEMLRHEDGIWRVRSPIHEDFAQRIARINANLGSLETAVSRFGRTGATQGDVERLFGADALRRSHAPPSR